MPSLIIQVYALPEELEAFSVGIVSEFDLHTVEMRFPPFTVHTVNADTLPASFRKSSGLF